MNQLLKIFFIVIASTSATYGASKCTDEISGKYGFGLNNEQLGYYGDSCFLTISADHVMRPGEKSYKSYRRIIFNNEGQIQIISNYPGSTNTNSTSSRIYYLFPLVTKRSVKVNDNDTLQFIHPSGVEFTFSKLGKFSSPFLDMTISPEINSTNSGGVEIYSYSKGIVVDLGARQGSTPATDMFRKIEVKDKNRKKCLISNNEFMYIYGPPKDRDANLRYKTNEEIHKYLSSKCPNLDLSDLLTKPLEKNLEDANVVKDGLKSPEVEKTPGEDSSGRTFTDKDIPPDVMEEFLNALDKENKEMEELEKNKASKDKDKNKEVEKKTSIK